MKHTNIYFRINIIFKNKWTHSFNNDDAEENKKRVKQFLFHHNKIIYNGDAAKPFTLCSPKFMKINTNKPF